MIARIIDFAIRHRTAVIVAAVLWGLCGAWVVANTPMDAVPDLSENQVLVYADWPGHGPEQIESQVTRPLSLHLQGLPGSTSIRGSSDVGRATLWIIFNESVTFPEARRRVQERLSAGLPQLPPNVVPRPAAEGIPTGQIFWYTIEGGGLDLAELRSLQDRAVAPQLQSVAGVAEVASVGGFVPELHVVVDPHKQAAAGVTLRDVQTELSRLDNAAGGHLVHKGNAEFLVQLRPPRASESNDTSAEPADATSGLRRRLEEMLIPARSGSVRLADIAEVVVGAQARRGVFERDGSEMVAGIVHLRFGHNVLEVTGRVKRRLREIAAGLPEGVRLVPSYDRSPLILGAVSTVTHTLVESLIVTTLCVLVVLRHFRASFVVALTLPLAALGAFLGMWGLRMAGIADVQTNIMSIAGIVVSIGVLVDSSIVIAENAMHRLHERFGDRPVTGDVRDTIAAACRTVGPPAFFSIAIMLVSFLPVFALGGIDGQMYRPLAWTKTLALASVAVLSITLVPALCTVFLRGRMRSETDSGVVRTVIGVYRPTLNFLLDHPGLLIVALCLTLVLAAAVTGYEWLLRAVAGGSLFVVVACLRSWRQGVPAAALVLGTALATQTWVTPIGRELRLPLDEGMVMDMPITVPRASIAQSGDDLKARNMVLCRFPEVHMVTGKAGRAETPFDPAPMDMIETMVEFRPKASWPRRRLLRSDAEAQARAILTAMVNSDLVEAPAATDAFIGEVVDAGLLRFDAVSREVAWQRTQPFLAGLSRQLGTELARSAVARLQRGGQLVRVPTDAELAALVSGMSAADLRLLVMSPSESGVSPLLKPLLEDLDRGELLKTGPDQALSSIAPSGLSVWFGGEPADLESALAADLQSVYDAGWLRHVDELNRELLHRAAGTWTQLACDEILSRAPIKDERLVALRRQVLEARYRRSAESHHGAGHAGLPPLSKLPIIDPHGKYDRLVKQLTAEFAQSLLLWPQDARSLTAYGGEMDVSVRMPGWANVWTKPIQNRVDMLATGVNSDIGVRVMGRDLDAVVDASEQIAAALRDLPGAANVVADPIRGKGTLDVVPDAARAAALGVSVADLNDTVEAALAGRVVATVDDGHIRRPVRLKLSAGMADDETALRRLPVQRMFVVPASAGDGTIADVDAPHSSRLSTVPLEIVADVSVGEGPATIKSENGWLRNYVRMSVPERDPSEVVAQAKRIVQTLTLPDGVFVEWTGQFEHAERTKRMLLQIVPVVLLLIGGILYLTYRDFGDAGLMLLSAPGALAGGAICQWLLGYPFSIAVGVGYIACFGMAAATGIVMLVYLREAVERAGGLERITLPQLREAVLQGAVHRLRPKLLTEITTVFSLAPMLWSTGVGSEVIRPMAAPVLGGILIADEVIDLLLPILFYHVRHRRWEKLHAVEQASSLARNKPPTPEP